MSRNPLGNVNVRYLYYRYMNKLEKEVNVRLGFGLFGAGCVAAAVGLVVFAYSLTLEAQSAAYETWAEVAYSLGLLALPLVFLGIVVLLPPDRKFLGLSGVGLVVCLGAAAGFVWAYPDAWHRAGSDATLQVLFPYAVGVGAIAVGIAASMREHAPELIETVTRIHEPDPSSDAGDAGDGGAAASGAGGGVDVDDVPDETAVVDDGPAETAVAESSDEPAQTEVVEEGAGPAGTGDGPVTLVINGRRYSFGDGDTFGRRDEPWLDDLIAAADGHEEIPYVSGEHLEFSVEDDGIYVSDDSRNGTKLNGSDITGETAKLSDGDTLVLSDRAKIGVEIDGN